MIKKILIASAFIGVGVFFIKKILPSLKDGAKREPLEPLSDLSGIDFDKPYRDEQIEKEFRQNVKGHLGIMSVAEMIELNKLKGNMGDAGTGLDLSSVANYWQGSNIFNM